MTNQAARIYTESPTHDIFSGVMNGDYILAGTVLYKDLENHAFAMQIKSVRTNDEFQTQIVGLGGYFREVMNTNRDAIP